MSVEHWEILYRGGALASCPMSFEPGYTREVREAWSAFFADLPDSARILDIGTGNGAIPAIAVAAAAALGRRFEIDAVDLAQIDPRRHVADADRLFAGVRFHGGASAESLPFEPASFDAVTGQYALEFMDAAKALPELYRVLKPGGVAQFVLHHADSILLQNIHESLAHADLILDGTRVFRRFRRYLEAERADRSRAQGPWQELVQAGDELQRAAKGAQQSMTLMLTLESLRSLFDMRGRRTAAAMAATIDRMEQDLRASVRRMQDVRAAARTQQDIAALVQAAQALGFEDIRFEAQLFAGDKLVGWRLQLRKA